MSLDLSIEDEITSKPLIRYRLFAIKNLVSDSPKLLGIKFFVVNSCLNWLCITELSILQKKAVLNVLLQFIMIMIEVIVMVSYGHSKFRYVLRLTVQLWPALHQSDETLSTRKDSLKNKGSYSEWSIFKEGWEELQWKICSYCPMEWDTRGFFLFGINLDTDKGVVWRA